MPVAVTAPPLGPPALYRGASGGPSLAGARVESLVGGGVEPVADLPGLSD
jgi:hypothetical protein